jgi:hypothetical protein
MTSESPLTKYFDKDKQRRGITAWGDCGTIIGWSKRIYLTCPPPKFVGGWWLMRKDKDQAIVGIHPEKITFCKECPIESRGICKRRITKK